MLYRDHKTLRTGEYYHIFNRGVNKQPIFFCDEDYFQFLKRLKIILNLDLVENMKTHIKPLPKNSFSILAYCLMPNHFHMLIRQNSEVGIDKLILKLCTSYSIYINKKYDRVGALFQDRFKAKLIDNDQYAQCVSAYINNNPKDPKSYPYSSYQEILSDMNETICDLQLLLSWFNHSREACVYFINNFQADHQLNQKFSFGS